MLYILSSCIGITSHTLLSTSSGFLPTESLWYLNLQSQKSSQSHTLLFLSVCKSNISLELSKLSTVPLPFYFLFIGSYQAFPHYDIPKLFLTRSFAPLNPMIIFSPYLTRLNPHYLPQFIIPSWKYFLHLPSRTPYWLFFLNLLYQLLLIFLVSQYCRTSGLVLGMFLFSNYTWTPQADTQPFFFFF